MNPTGIEAAEEAEVFADRAWWQAAGDVLNLQLHGWTYRLNASFVDRETKAYVALTGAMANRLLALAKPTLPADVAGLVERLKAVVAEEDDEYAADAAEAIERGERPDLWTREVTIPSAWAGEAANTITSLSARAEAAEAALATAREKAKPLAYRAERWKLNSDKARVSAPLGELRGILSALSQQEAK